MENLIIIGIVLAVFIVALFAIPFFKKKGIATPDSLHGIEKVSYIAHNIINALQLDAGAKRTFSEVLDIVDAATEYIEDFIEHDGEDKLNISIDAIGVILSKLGVNPTDSEQNVINILIEESLKFLEKTKK